MVKKLNLRKRGDSDQELESRLSETIQRYKLIFAATNDVLYDLNVQTGTIIWNDALYTQYGYDKDEKADRVEWWTSRIHPDDALQFEHELGEWFEGKQETWQAEYRFLKADGSYVYVKDRGVLLRAPDGSPQRIIGSLLDITKQKKLDQAKDEFISLVAHQLRTPLTAIRIHSEMLTSGAFGQLTNDQKAYIQNITDVCLRMIKLVDDTLSVSRVELGYTVSNPLPVDVNRFLAAHVEEVRPLASEKGVALYFEPDPAAGLVSIDETIFGQIVHNLLTNAIRYTKPQTGDVKVSFKQNKDGYLLSVKDNGIGIPESSQPYVFDLFYRAENTLNTSEQGTGLGLYLVKLLADATGCKVWLESDEDKGAVFYVQLPPHGMKPR